MESDIHQLSSQICQVSQQQHEQALPGPWNNDQADRNRYSVLMRNVEKDEIASSHKRNRESVSFSQSKGDGFGNRYLSQSFQIQKVKNDNTAGNSKGKQRIKFKTSISNYQNSKRMASSRYDNNKRGFLTSFQLQGEHSNKEFQQSTKIYSNEQKAKISLSMKVHERKNKKLCNVLRLKTSSIGKDSFEDRSVSRRNNQILETLEKVSKDQMMRKSINRALMLLKKRSSKNLLRSQEKIYSDVSEQSFKSAQKTISTSHQISKTKNHLRSDSPSCQNDFLQIKHLESGSIDEYPKTQSDQKTGRSGQGVVANKQKAKVLFKPKRRHLTNAKKQVKINCFKINNESDEQTEVGISALFPKFENPRRHLTSRKP